MQSVPWKNIVLCFVTLLLSLSINAQKPSVQQLKAKLSHQQKPDINRVNLLNELANRSEIHPAFRDSLLDQSIQLAQSLNDPAGESYATTIKAIYGGLGQSIFLSKQALVLAQKSGNKKILFWAYRCLGQSMIRTSGDTNAIVSFQKALALAMSINNAELIISGQLNFVDYYKTVDVNYPLALEWGLKALQTAEQYHDTLHLPAVYRNIGAIYLLIGDMEKSLRNLQKAIITSNQTGDYETAQYALNDMGEQYRLKGMYPEALKAYSEAALLIKDNFNIELNQSNVADVYQRMGDDPLSFQYAYKALAGAKYLKDTIGIAWIDNILSRAYLHTGKTDSAIYYAAEGYRYAVHTQAPEYVRDNSEALANAYSAKRNFEKALDYYKIFISSRDTIFNTEINNRAHLAQYNYDIVKKQSEIESLNKDKELQESKVARQQLLIIGITAILFIILASLILLYRTTHKRKKAYALLHRQKQEIQAQRDQTHQALNELKLTQAQLIQSEKMASLGELTAGIAHEIQNPLNFVNNFSDVNAELIDEMEAEIEKGDTAESKTIAKDIRENNAKIAHHGKRADSIVKGMLQHSRVASGQKEPTNINALAEEYLRLAYHGLRAKDKSFNATLVTHFDEKLPKIEMVPQDIGRVLLNLFTNAFYAMQQKQKGEDSSYKAELQLSTALVGTIVEIQVKDNGTGIPDSIKGKILQPFFTTKPSGEGTGLGLSLSYDIVVKGHGGNIYINSREGEGAAFIVQLPLQKS